uniref:YggT family protein n=1 Tax=Chloropicon laureae TaxID=464258 RepID=A0A7S2Z0G7_9CHLO|mmetsp:Transcript_13045/g.33753  ORF Transcript_13045/g.33753 Transcript_13045/m.33753 type:complete len:198 (+) Transcript_13045:127-720(+)
MSVSVRARGAKALSLSRGMGGGQARAKRGARCQGQRQSEGGPQRRCAVRSARTARGELESGRGEGGRGEGARAFLKRLLFESEALPGAAEFSGGFGLRRAKAGARACVPAAVVALQASIFGTVLDVFYVAVLVRILSSWFPNMPPLLDPVVNLSRDITEPVFQPFRQLIPPLRLGGTMIDISGIIVIFLINFLRRYA